MGLDHLRYLYERSVGVMLAIVIPMAVVIFFLAGPIVLLIAGKEYLAAVPVLQVFAVMSVFKPFGRQGGTILDSMGYPKYNSLVILIGLVVNFFLNWLLMERLKKTVKQRIKRITCLKIILQIPRQRH